MKKQISLLLAIVMVLSMIMVPGVFSFGASADETGPVQIKVHYTREDGNYEGWDVFQWNGISVTPFEVAEDGSEAVATIYAYANPGDIGFIVRYGGDDWTDRVYSDEEKTTGDRSVLAAFPELSSVKSGTIHVYVDNENPTVTTAEAGEDVVYGEPEVVEYDITIKVHYYREDAAYSDWEVHMWNGVESLDSTRPFELEEVEYDGTTYGATATYYADASDTWVGFIIKKPDWTKDPDGDRKIDVSDVTGGTVHVYAKSGSALEDFVTDKSEATLGAKVTAAVYDNETGKLTVTTSYPLENVTVDTFTLEGPDGAMTITAVEAVDEYNYLVSFEGEMTDDKVYTLYYNGVACTVTVPNVYSTEAFEAEYTYEGDDLGAAWTAEGTTFRVWAPTASAVSVNLYQSGTQGTDDLIQTVEMTSDVNGTWVATVEGDLNGTYYTYSVTRSGETVEACDPYARTTGVNGNRAMVIDLDSTDPAGWENDTYVVQDEYTDAVIWELHVRDFSIDASSGVSEANRGNYLAFTEEGTTVNGEGEISTGIDYMAELGINYVHLLPVYDINSVDETTDGYNWGYDPKNYNVPEGSYASDPYNGEVRVNEFKQMVQSLHDNGIGVIMDVVYNHVADAGNFCFNQIVPGYFSRIHDDGSYQSDSGCGNDTASERSMVSKYIVDSVLYWNQEYHIDGFRWDLVGLIDYETINAVMEAVHAVNPDIIFYGEGWDMCTWTTKEDRDVPYSQKMTIQNNDEYFNTEVGVFALFNDTIRNVIHGGVFTATDKGFVMGNLSDETVKTVTDSYMGNSTWGTSGGTVDTPLQTVNYASCHDNYTLYDNFLLDVQDVSGGGVEDSYEEAAGLNKLAAAYYITAQGVPFIHAGEEMLRSKPDESQENGFNHNSYAAGDEINAIKWYTLADELVDDAHDYYQGLIAFRAAHPALRMTNEEEVLSTMSVLDTGDNDLIAILNEGGNGEDETILSIFNTNGATTYKLPTGTWNVYVNSENAGTEILDTVSGTIEIDRCSAMILVKSDVEIPDAPNMYTEIIPSSGKIRINWDAVEGAVAYELYCDKGVYSNDRDDFELVCTTKGTKVNHISAEVDVTYGYYVVAVDADGRKSVPSEVAHQRCLAPRPKISISNNAATGDIQLTWTAVEGAAKYQVYSATSEEGPYSLLYTAKSTKLNHGSAEVGVTYYYKVRALNADGEVLSAFSGWKYRCCDCAQPEVSVSLNKNGKPALTWDAVEGAQKYRVYVYGEDGELLNKVNVKSKLTHSSAVAGETYTYQVVAVGPVSSANSAPSEAVTVTAK